MIELYANIRRIAIDYFSLERFNAIMHSWSLLVMMPVPNMQYAIMHAVFFLLACRSLQS